MAITLDPNDRARLREFLENRFNLEELETLAFDLGIDYNQLPHATKPQFSMNLVEYFEHRDNLNCLLTAMRRQRHDDFLTQLSTKLPPGCPRTKVQIIITRDVLDDNPSVLIADLAAKLKINVDQVEFIGATWGSLQVLVSLPEDVANVLINSKVQDFVNGKYQVSLITAFDSLDTAKQEAWQKTARDELRRQIRALRGLPAETPHRADLCRQALELVSRQDEPKLWAGLQFEWGICLIQMAASDPAQNLENAIARFQQALKVYTAESYPVDWASVQHNLGVIYRQRPVGDRAENQEEAIRCYERALTVFTQAAWPQDWADATFNLANVYAQRIGGVPQDNMERAIAGYEAVLQVYTQSAYPVMWAKVQCQLGRAWSNYHWNNLAANLDKALQYYQAALSVLTPQDQAVEWSVAQHGLGKVWLARITGNHDDNATQAIHCFAAALQVRRREIAPDDWADTMHNLGVAYLQLASGDRAKNVERAIEVLTQALEVQTPEVDRLKSAEVTCKLADAFSARIDGGRAENLQHAIRLYRSALLTQKRHGTPQDWGPTSHNLAVAYSEHRLGTRTRNLARAAARGKSALSAFDPSVNLSEWANVKTNLMDILWKLANSQRHSDPAAGEQNMEDAIAHGQDVLRAMTGQAPSQRQALAQYNLGNAFGDRLAGKRADNQTQAIRYYEQALRFYTRQDYPWRRADTLNNLGVTYQERVDGDRAENLRRAIEHYNEALAICPPDTSPVLAQRAARNLGNLYFQEQRWPEAIAAYQPALQATEYLYRTSLARSSKEVELIETGDLYRHSAYALARALDYTGACVMLEQGRARLLSEVLERDWTDLKKLETLGRKDLLDSYTKSAEHLRNLESLEVRSGGLSPASDRVALLQSARAELDRAIQSIRQIKGYESFFQPPTFQQIQRDCAVNHSSAGVYLTAPEFGSLALILNSNGAEAVRLDDFTAASLDLLLAQREGGQDFTAATLDKVLPILETQVVAPVAQRLHELGVARIVLIPTGLLSLLPWHAAKYQQGGRAVCLLDEFDVAYTPSARVLGNARQRLESRPIIVVKKKSRSFKAPERLFSRLLKGQSQNLCLNIGLTQNTLSVSLTLWRISAASEMTSRYPICQPEKVSRPVLAGIGNPLDHPKPRPSDDPKPLPFARPELEEVATFFAEDARHAFYERAATKERLLAVSQSATYVHLSCHGLFDVQDPLNSHLQLAAGDTLTLREVMNSKHFEQARLVVLSACQTAITDFNKLPDEAIGLPAGFFQAGVPGVIGTLWSVNDLSTMLLMVKFYECHLKAGLAPTAALRKAQLWLRDVTNEDLYSLTKEYCQRPDWSDQSHSVFESARQRFRDAMSLYPDQCPYAHPYYWAAFAFYGV